MYHCSRQIRIYIRKLILRYSDLIPLPRFTVQTQTAPWRKLDVGYIVATNETILVVGGGISGISAALEAGKQVILTEKNAYIGGRVAQLHKYFLSCHPTWVMEINQRRTKSPPI